jgi:hypothetical protein
VPFDFTAPELKYLADIETQSVPEPIWTKLLVLFVLLVPNWPVAFKPHDHKVPFDLSAMVNLFPAV